VNVDGFAKAADLFPLIALSIVIAAICVGAIALDPIIHIFMSISLIVIVIVAMVVHRKGTRGDLSFFLIIPTILSALQNVYLGMISPSISQFQVQFLVILNFLLALVLIPLLATNGPQRRVLLSEAFTSTYDTFRLGLIKLLVALVAFSAMSVAIFHGEASSALASFRNISAPIVFFFLGYLASPLVRLRNYSLYLVLLAGVVVAIGLWELFGDQNMWITLNIADLWLKKGIKVEYYLIPANFFSSEYINGQHVRRMVSSFADPVNLGTFFFAAFMAAWFLRNRFAAFLIILGATLTISKGALLGLLVFAIFWARTFASKTIQFLIVALAGAGALAFYLFSLSNSSGSTAAHINGFVAGFVSLPAHPLGQGLGRTGVLASLFSEGADSDIAESGLGLVIGQLGVVGLAIYVLFFVAVIRASSRVVELRQRVYAQGLLIGFAFNASFNEVALSPNSSAPYFTILGIIIGRSLLARARESNEHGLLLRPVRERISSVGLRRGRTWAKN
jgi:hypothetical protein